MDSVFKTPRGLNGFKINDNDYLVYLNNQVIITDDIVALADSIRIAELLGELFARRPTD